MCRIQEEKKLSFDGYILFSCGILLKYEDRTLKTYNADGVNLSLFLHIKLGTSPVQVYANVSQESYKNEHCEKNSEIEWRDRVQSHRYDDETFTYFLIQYEYNVD
jgi:hypothetical protein